MLNELQAANSLSQQRGRGIYTPPSDSFEISLDEPISITIKRELQSVWKKLMYVIHPRSVQEAGAGLRDWELWGPLILCISLSLLLYFSKNGGAAAGGLSSSDFQEERRFAFVLVYMFLMLGSSIVTLNAQLLGSRLSFFQCVCVLGYCLFPLTAAAAANLLFLNAPRGFRLFTVLPALAWAGRVASAFLQPLTDIKRRILVVYPVILFYVAVSAIICAI